MKDFLQVFFEMIGKLVAPATCAASCVYLAADGKPKWLALGAFVLVFIWRADSKTGARS